MNGHDIFTSITSKYQNGYLAAASVGRSNAPTKGTTMYGSLGTSDVFDVIRTSTWSKLPFLCRTLIPRVLQQAFHMLCNKPLSFKTLNNDWLDADGNV